jgi:hypothetical protein
MAAPLFRIGLPSTIWLSSVGIAFADYMLSLDFGLIGTLSWLVVLSGVFYFVRFITN